MGQGRSRLWIGFGLACLTGCSTVQTAFTGSADDRPDVPRRASILAENELGDGISARPSRNTRYLTKKKASLVSLRPRVPAAVAAVETREHEIPALSSEQIKMVDHEIKSQSPSAVPAIGTLTVNGRTYRVQLQEEVLKPAVPDVVTTASGSLPPAPATLPVTDFDSLELSPSELTPTAEETLRLNLPTALSMIGGEHPVVGFAQWRVQEAYARLDQANVLWLPSIQPGFSFDRHDGNLQPSDGSIVDVNRNSFQYGLGAGATGAGTTPVPGLVARFHLADAIFQPEIAEKTAWARGHAVDSALNEQLFKVASAYLELLESEQNLRILEETRNHTSGLAKLTHDYAATGQGLQADADRMKTELTLDQNRVVTGRERIALASARLSETLSIDSGQLIQPLDFTVVPLELVNPELDKGTLISTGLANRPELKEAQTLVAVACEQYKRQKYAPFIPSVLLGFSTGGFGGGLSDSLSDVGGRYDFDALVTWEIRNLGFGEGAARRETQAQIEQAKFQQIKMLDQVAREISEAQTQVKHRAESIRITRNGIKAAEESYQRNLSRIRDGQGLPIEVLQSVRALESARRAYLTAVVQYNQAQFRLQWALGWPVFDPSEPVANAPGSAM
ncbi:TolC family protein [Gimesia sp.]|uniref:TolC family protein n=1 Tax=Gimesia sp. TaxID=2024833 RepID=UPI003A931617